nr:DNA topoisomerase 1 isoform X1 [Vanessa tameamea]
MPLIEPTPPPLPANPPPSSVVSFAATTMAPELTDASLANNADIISNAAHNETSDTNTEKTEAIPSDIEVESQQNVTNVVETVETSVQITDSSNETLLNAPSSDVQSEKMEEIISNDISHESDHAETNVQTSSISDTDITNDAPVEIEDSVQKDTDKVLSENQTDLVFNVQVDSDKASANEENVKKSVEVIKNELIPENMVTDSNVDNLKENDEIEKENLLNESKSSLGKLETVETNDDEKVIMNGDSKSVIDETAQSVKPIVTPEDSMPPSLSEAMESLPQGGGDAASNDASESFPLPPSELCRSESDMSPPDTPEPPADTHQEVLSTSDKMKELIPEVPTIPELKTEMETTTDVAVAN